MTGRPSRTMTSTMTTSCACTAHRYHGRIAKTLLVVRKSLVIWQLSDRFGTLRFRIEMSRPLGLIFVTVIDAWDLPPMDSDGMADPYVEVREGGAH